jgi:uncharacterized membrane protein
VEAHLLQWLHLAVRWLHVIVGAAWIGTSFYFNWLNDSLRPSSEARSGVSGELWSVHGGSFYQVSKYDVAPDRLPEKLHWFKWEAYFTWITGFLLLGMIYYMGSGAFLVDSRASAIGPGAATVVGLVTLFGGWVVYDALCRSPLGKRSTWLAVVLFAFTVLVAYALSKVLSPRAAYIHVGAMLGTWMAANVFRVIIPSQRAMVQSMADGIDPDAKRGKQAALRSLHNNYLTLPVLYVMVSNHYPVTYAHPSGWLVLAGMFAIGVAARHYYNLRHRGHHVAWLLPAAALGMLALALTTSPDMSMREPSSVGGRGERAAYPVIRAILEQRCVACHSANPTHPTVAGVAPLGVELDTAQQAATHAERIARAVESGIMPLGNLTGMTQEERDLVVRWVNEGAARPCRAPGSPRSARGTRSRSLRACRTGPPAPWHHA